MVIDSVFITGANSGLGKDTARQLALLGTSKIYLSGRNESRLQAAKQDLEHTTGKHVFEIIVADTSNFDQVRAAVAALPEPVEGLVMNAGGVIGSDTVHEESGALTMIAINLLGHVILFDELVKANKLTKVAIYAGSEAAIGIPRMGFPQPAFNTHSVDEFARIIDGSFFSGTIPEPVLYGYTKYFAAMWMGAMARQNPYLRVVTVSPGGTTGTAGADKMSGMMRVMMKVVMPVMAMFDVMHDLETGARRYVDVLTNNKFQSGAFYASPQGKMTGSLVDQTTIQPAFSNTTYQDNVNQAVHRFTAP